MLPLKVASALVASPAFTETSNGYLGTSDGGTDLIQHYKLTAHYSSAPNGTVVQTGRLPLTGLWGSRHLTLALGFAAAESAALDTANASLGAGFAGVGVAMGGIVSGALLENFWWGSIFLINVFVVVAALVAGFFLIPRSREKIHAPLDPLGALLSIAGLSALVYGIIEAPDNGWLSTQTIVTFGSAIVILAGFVAWQLKAKEPMLDLRFFRNPRFTAATTAITLVFFAMFGSYFLFTQYLQFVHGYNPLSAGVRILPWALAYMASATQSAKLVERSGQRLVVSSGLMIAGTTLRLTDAFRLQ